MENFVYWLLKEESESRRIPASAIKISLPKVEQTTGYTCGAAALRAICLYYGIGPDDEDDYRRIVGSDPDDGTPPKNIVKAAKKLGFHVKSKENMTLDNLRMRLTKGIPVICALQAWGPPKQYHKDSNGHYVIAIGYDDDKIYFEDPSMKKNRGFLTNNEFLERWHDKETGGTRYERLGIAIWTVKMPEKPVAKHDTKFIEADIIT